MARHKFSEETKTNILTTANKLFQERGWDKVKIEDVVKEIGMTRGAFYHYFDSREDLIYQVVDQMFLEDNPFAKALDLKGMSGLEKLRVTFKENIGSQFNNDPDFVAQWKETMSNPILFKSEVYSSVNTIAPFLQRILEEGNQDGTLNVKYPKQTAESLVMLSNAWLNPITFEVTQEEYFEKLEYWAYMCNQLGVPLVDDEVKEQMKHLHQHVVRDLFKE